MSEEENTPTPTTEAAPPSDASPNTEAKEAAPPAAPEGEQRQRGGREPRKGGNRKPRGEKSDGGDNSGDSESAKGDDGSGNRGGRNRNRRGRKGSGNNREPRPIAPSFDVDAEDLKSKAWKIYVAELGEEGIELFDDAQAAKLAQRAFKLAEIFLYHESTVIERLNAPKEDPAAAAEKTEDSEEKKPAAEEAAPADAPEAPAEEAATDEAPAAEVVPTEEA